MGNLRRYLKNKEVCNDLYVIYENMWKTMFVRVLFEIWHERKTLYFEEFKWKGCFFFFYLAIDYMYVGRIIFLYTRKGVTSSITFVALLWVVDNTECTGAGPHLKGGDDV